MGKRKRKIRLDVPRREGIGYYESLVKSTKSMDYYQSPFIITMEDESKLNDYFKSYSDDSIDIHIKEKKKKVSDILPEHINEEILVAILSINDNFLQRYSKRRIDKISFNSHDGTLLAALPAKEGEIPFIEYKFADQLLKLKEELTPQVISNNLLEAIMKMCLHAKDM